MEKQQEKDSRTTRLIKEEMQKFLAENKSEIIRRVEKRLKEERKSE